MTASWRGAGRTEEIELNDEIVLWVSEGCGEMSCVRRGVCVTLVVASVVFALHQDKNGVRINTTAASRRRRKLVSLGVFLLILILQVWLCGGVWLCGCVTPCLVAARDTPAHPHPPVYTHAQGLFTWFLHVALASASNTM